MTAPVTTVHTLIIDDDQELLDQVRGYLDGNIKGAYKFYLDTCLDFDEGIRRIEAIRYDLVISDVWLGRKHTEPDDNKIKGIIDSIQKTRFCPIVVYSTAKPSGLTEGPFIEFADKGMDFDTLMASIDKILSTGVPDAARSLHNDLDTGGANFLWQFLETNWSQLKPKFSTDPHLMGRLLRKRASVLLGRLDSSKGAPVERETVHGMEYYLYPPVSPEEEFRLGDLVKENSTGQFHVVLNPHCHLVKQPKHHIPRAEFALLAAANPVEEAINAARQWEKQVTGKDKPAWSSKPIEAEEQLGKRVRVPSSEMGTPDGRFFFLPNFLEIPNLFCDLLQIKTKPMKDLRENYTRIATLDAPFAEAIQSMFLRLFGGVGLPVLDPKLFKDLLPKPSTTQPFPLAVPDPAQ